jgi:hypothetical protein
MASDRLGARIRVAAMVRVLRVVMRDPPIEW